MSEQNMMSKEEETSIKENMPERKLASVKKRRTRLILITVVITGVIGYLLYTGTRDSMAYYLTVSELTAQSSQLTEQGVRIGGNVREGSIVWDPKTLQLEFVIEDDETMLLVVYQGVIPDSFKQGNDVIVEGIYRDGVLRASQLMPTCPSKYEGK